MSAALPRLAGAALLLRICAGDVIASHHVQTPGVQTCDELGGTCRVPPEDSRKNADACQAGEQVREYETWCDSGCGYWRGRCGQPCCVPVASQERSEGQERNASQDSNASQAGLEEKASVDMASVGAKGAGVASLAWIDCVALVAVAGMAMILYRCTCSRDTRQPSLLQNQIGTELPE
eukprot:CAMPEP_0204606352 /NCGR_PEP_ID=MMETSP0661-20131031/59043_1 /ASSEMBLY_ACC=CAM_ASM_000606 /TAXON_ID=109239 /ORGANISM="Alexandrium margalefi, Strain AMGDE01CS-322" /LENGTH=177 /DNA_ID=CAMNT_0051617671 /DNA_START=25 /DNA_END=558 /DNA_ORIENTATION=-